jgi:two-component system nitrogen regulation response regulator GlnG
MNRLKQYHWPGNVRELENLVRRLAALYVEDIIGPDIIDTELSETGVPLSMPSAMESDNLSSAVDHHLQRYFAAHGDDLPPAGLYLRVLRELERPLIIRSLAATRGNQIKAAELLGLNRNTLRKKIRDLGIEVVKSGAMTTSGTAPDAVNHILPTANNM